MINGDETRLICAGPTLPERIRALREEADAFLDESARRLSETTPGVPLHVLRNLISNRSHLRPGERGVVMCLACDRDQARIVLNYGRRLAR